MSHYPFPPSASNSTSASTSPTTSTSAHQFRQFLALTPSTPAHTPAYNEHQPLLGPSSGHISFSYDSIPSTPRDGFGYGSALGSAAQSRRASRIRSRSSRLFNPNWSRSIRIPDWVSIYSLPNPSASSLHPPPPPIDRKGGYDAEFKSELAGQSGNGMRVWYDTYTSVDWLHEHVKQSIRRKHLSRIPGLRGRLRRCWDKSQAWLLVTLIGISTALMAALIVSLEMRLFDLKEGYCSTRWTSPKRFCCASSPTPSSISAFSLNSTQIPPQSFISSLIKLSPFDGFTTHPSPRSSPFTSTSFINQWATLPTTTSTHSCPDWILWTDLFNTTHSTTRKRLIEFSVYLTIALCFAGLSSLMTVYLSSSDSVQSLKDRPPGPSPPDSPQVNNSVEPSSVLDPCLHSLDPQPHQASSCSPSSNLPHISADRNPTDLNPAELKPHPDFSSPTSSATSVPFTIVPQPQPSSGPVPPPIRSHKVAYFAAGSGIPEIKCILSGFVIRGYLGTSTMLTKSFGLALSVASGLSLGKEGPLVHIASCIGNIFTRCFKKFDRNEAKRREVLSAACAAGVSVAFGAPIGGVLFSLEEVSYFFPPRVMWRSCWCAMVAAATLRVLDPFKTGKTVLFEVTYDRQWHFFELGGFILLGILGGILGAWFAQANVWWTQNVRKRTWLNFHPIAEVLLVTAVTAVLGSFNPFLKMGGSELVYQMLAECPNTPNSPTGPCLKGPSQTGSLLKSLGAAASLKFLTTIVTFGIKCPAGIFVPSLAVGALLGRILGIVVEYAFYKFPHSPLFSHCAAALNETEGLHQFGKACVLPGVWAMVGAAAMLAGVTRTTVSLVVIVAELTGSLVYILPIAISVLVAKTTADAIESRSIYDLVIEASELPYLDAKSEYIHSSVPSDIMDEAAMVICVEDRLRASELRAKLDALTYSNSAGGFPLVSCDEYGQRIVGYIGRGELEHGLASITRAMVAMDPVVLFEGDGEFVDEDTQEARVIEDAEGRLVVESEGLRRRKRIWGTRGAEEQAAQSMIDEQIVDLSYLVDHAPVTLSIRTPMEILHEMFVKLGVRYLVIQDERGLYSGIIERARWLRYLSWVEHKAHLQSSSKMSPSSSQQ